MKPKLIGIEHRVGEIVAVLFVERVHGAVERGEIAMLLRDQHRRGFDLVGDVERVFVEAEQEVGARLAAAQELIGIGGIDAHLVALLFQRPHRLFQMREGRIRAGSRDRSHWRLCAHSPRRG